MKYTIAVSEDYKDFIERVLSGKISEDKMQMFVFLMEVIVTEIIEARYSISIDVEFDEVSVSINHNGHALKKNILDIIYDQVDYLHYRHQSKDSHTLIIRKHLTVINDSNF